MSSNEDAIHVIELGSSDDETEPTPKKLKPSLPNAMVHIPKKLHGITIKPTKSNLISVSKALAGKPVTVCKVLSNPFANKTKVNGKPNPIRINSNNVTIQKPNITINKHYNSVQAKPIPYMVPKKFPPANQLPKPVKIMKPVNLNTLPSSITVTPVSKRKVPVSQVQMDIKRSKPVPKIAAKNILTVNLDDEDASMSSTSSHQWYIRPEEQQNTIEQENNTEPNSAKLIEITIEDSPIKPVLGKQTCEIGTEFAITIEDSPVKVISNKNTSSERNIKKQEENKNHHSKKQLKYPKDIPESEKEPEGIEIEIAPMPVIFSQDNSNTVNVHDDVEEIIDDIEVQVQEQKGNVNKHEKTSPKTEKSEHFQNTVEKHFESKEESEFHPIYQSFIDLCFKLEDSEDMKKIVEKKVKAYYKQVPKEYTESEAFLDMVSSKLISMKASPEKMYLYIKDIVDELNLQRKMMKSQDNKVDTLNTESENFLFGEDSEYDFKRQRQIRKLEKTLKKLHRAIQKLEEQEVDFDDEEDSVYLLTERYKERMVRVHAKFCQLTNTKMPSEPRIQFDARPGQPSGPAKRLEKWINKKVPIGTPLPFPDFHDVIRCVKEANEEDKLHWNDVEIMEEARDLFTRCGKKLQRRRQENEWRLAVSRISVDVDPADRNEDLKKELDNNRLLATKKETEVFNKFADRQKQMNLEAEEIGDKEAEESPVESEEEEINEETPSLENTEKRKERLKRLLQEKSKKNEEETAKENNNSEKPVPAKADNNVAEDIGPKEVDNKLQTNENDFENNTAKDTDVKDKGIEKSHSLSDDSNKVESDIDELHLLQKLHSGNDANTSTLDSSDSDSLIAISDTLGSSSEKQQSGVISIENSSFSESEVIQENSTANRCVSLHVIDEKIIDNNMEIECSAAGVEKIRNISNNDEYNESVEDILLASSSDEEVTEQDIDNCVNLRDDTISIGDTVVEDPQDFACDKNREQVASVATLPEIPKDNDTSSVESIVIVPEKGCPESEQKDNSDTTSQTTADVESDQTTKNDAHFDGEIIGFSDSQNTQINNTDVTEKEQKNKEVCV